MLELSAPFDRGRLIAALVLVASVLSLATALIGEHVFGLEPCILCLYERIPYAVAGVLAGAALFLVRRNRWRSLLLGVAAGVFAIGAALAVYHVGVEEHWWGSIAACGGELATGAEGEDLRYLSAADLKPCDQVDWRLFGLSLAGYNALFSLTLAGISVAGVRAFSKRA